MSGNVSLYNETGGRPIPPTPVVGCVGLVRDVTHDSRPLANRGHRYLLQGGGAELIGFVWRNAASFTLAHDVSDGGLALALREAAAWSGAPFVPSSARGRRRGVIVAATERPDWPDVVELGVV